MSGIQDLVARAEGGPYFTIATVASKVGRSEDTIKRWIKNERREGHQIGPSHKMMLGENEKSFVWLYTEEDVSRLIAYAATRKPGRPPKKEAVE